MPYKFNPISGQFDFFKSKETAVSAERLSFKKQAAEDISALRLVILDSNDLCRLARLDTLENSSVVGIALNGGASGSLIEILTLGVVNDAFFTFPVNVPLFLNDTGQITDSVPSSGISVRIGNGLGNGAIYIKIERPIIL